MREIGVLLGAAVVLLLPACGGDASSDSAVTLVGTTWEWNETQTADSSAVTPGAPSKYTLLLEDGGRAQIGADCNRATGTYALAGNTLTIEIGPTTQAFCGADSLSTEYLRQLGAVTAQTLDRADLSLSLGDEGGTMRFSAS